MSNQESSKKLASEAVPIARRIQAASLPKNLPIGSELNPALQTPKFDQSEDCRLVMKIGAVVSETINKLENKKAERPEAGGNGSPACNSAS